MTQSIKPIKDNSINRYDPKILKFRGEQDLKPQFIKGQEAIISNSRKFKPEFIDQNYTEALVSKR